MNIQFKNLLLWPRLAAGFAGIALATAALAAVLVWAPTPADDSIEAPAPERTPAGRARCAECGVVVSRREIEQPGGDSSLKSSRISPARYEITVRLGDGSSRVIDDASPASWRAGERVTLIDGVSRPVR